MEHTLPPGTSEPTTFSLSWMRRRYDLNLFLVDITLYDIMSFIITVELPTRDYFLFHVRAYKGEALFPLYKKKIIDMAYRHLGVTRNEYHLAVLFGDEEEVLTAIYQRRQPSYSPDELHKHVAHAIQTCNYWAWCEMERTRVFTRDTTIHIRSVPHPTPLKLQPLLCVSDTHIHP